MVEVSKDGDTVAFVQEWLMNSDYDPTQFDRGFAAAIDARSATLQAERDRYRVALEAIVNGNPTIDSPEGHASWDFIIARTALSDAPVQS